MIYCFLLPWQKGRCKISSFRKSGKNPPEAWLAWGAWKTVRATPPIPSDIQRKIGPSRTGNCLPLLTRRGSEGLAAQPQNTVTGRHSAFAGAVELL